MCFWAFRLSKCITMRLHKTKIALRALIIIFIIILQHFTLAAISRFDRCQRVKKRTNTILYNRPFVLTAVFSSFKKRRNKEKKETAHTQRLLTSLILIFQRISWQFAVLPSKISGFSAKSESECLLTSA